MYFTIYRITNQINGNEYIGQHQTEDINDNYMGSGVALKNAYDKYGISNFTKEILHVFDNFDEMNRKEIELVDINYISRKDTYNIILGGVELNTSNTILVVEDGKCRRIPSSEYDPSIHKTPTSNSVLILDNVGNCTRVSSSEYNPSIHKTPSSGYVSVRFNDGSTGRVRCSDFDDTIHTKVLGGAVAVVNGVAQYVDSDMIGNGVDGIHKGKVTVRDLDGICKHVTVDEYHNNRDNYTTNGSGRVSVKDVFTGENKSILRDEYDRDPDKWILGTTGFRTVYDINLEKFVNIRKECYDNNIHRLASDKYIICYDADGIELFRFWGSKKQFISKFKPVSMYDAAIKSSTFETNRKHEYNGCLFSLVDWKNDMPINPNKWTDNIIYA